MAVDYHLVEYLDRLAAEYKMYKNYRYWALVKIMKIPAKLKFYWAIKIMVKPLQGNPKSGVLIAMRQEISDNEESA